MTRVMKNIVRFLKQYLRQRLFNINQFFYLATQRENRSDALSRLLANGYVIFPKALTIAECNEFIYLSGYQGLEEIHTLAQDEGYIKLSLSINSLMFFYAKLREAKIFDVAFNYLGIRSSDYFALYETSIIGRGCSPAHTNSMQPHHDTKYQRLKLYLWLTDKVEPLHPLYYLRGSHKSIKTWNSYEDTRYSDISKNSMDCIKPSLGDIILFDTHGIHSHFKDFSLPRCVFNHSIDPCGNKFLGISRESFPADDEVRIFTRKEWNQFIISSYNS